MKISAIALAALSALSLAGCGTMIQAAAKPTVVKSWYDADHPPGSVHRAVVAYVADTPMARARMEKSSNPALFDGLPDGAVLFRAIDRYDGWTYFSAMYGWTSAGSAEVGDLVTVRNGGFERDPSEQILHLTSWDDPRPSGCFFRGNLYRPNDEGRVVCEDSAEAVPYRLKARLDMLTGAAQHGYKTEAESYAMVASTLVRARAMGFSCDLTKFGGAKSGGWWCKLAAGTRG